MLIILLSFRFMFAASNLRVFTHILGQCSVEISDVVKNLFGLAHGINQHPSLLLVVGLSMAFLIFLYTSLSERLAHLHALDVGFLAQKEAIYASRTPASFS